MIGENCAGAVQFIRLDRLEEKEIAERLRALRGNHNAGRLPRDEGQFSLAGAQPKTAFLFENGRWGVPYGRVPTTRILKPTTGEFDGHPEMNTIAFNWPARSASPFRIPAFNDLKTKLPWWSTATTGSAHGSHRAKFASRPSPKPVFTP